MYLELGGRNNEGMGDITDLSCVLASRPKGYLFILKKDPHDVNSIFLQGRTCERTVAAAVAAAVARWNCSLRGGLTSYQMAAGKR